MKYYAFISYSHADSDWAKWLQHEFEYYKLPSTFNGREDVPSSFRPVFRDEDELSGGNLTPQIIEALSDSEYLIVICSPASSQSSYVNSEIRDFLKIGVKRGADYSSKIFPIIVGGKPNVGTELECFPEAIREIKNQSGEKLDLIAGDVTKTGRNHAFVKVLAGTLKNKNIEFAQLWNRFEHEKLLEEKRKKEERDNLYIMQSHFLAERAMKVAKTRDSVLATKIALYALPNDINDSDDRPVVASAERLLRLASRRVYSQYDQLGIPFKFISDNTIKSESQTVNVLTGAFEEVFTDTNYESKRKMLWEVITDAGYRIILRGLKTNTDNSIAIFVCFFRRAIIIWDIKERKEISSFPVDQIESNHNLYFIFDDNYIVYYCKTEAKIVNIEKLQVVYTHDNMLSNLRFDRVHQRLIWLEDGHIYSFNVQSEQYEESFGFVQELLHSFKISEDSGFIAGINDEGIIVYNYLTNEYVTSISIDGDITSYDLFGSYLCFIHNNCGQNYITVYNINKDKFIYQRLHNEGIGYYSISTNQHYIAYRLNKWNSKVIVENLNDDTFTLFASMSNDASNTKGILDFAAFQDEILVLYPDRSCYINMIDASQNIDSIYAPGLFPMRKIGKLADGMYLYSDTQFILTSGSNSQTTEIRIYKGLPFTVSPNGHVVAYSRHLNLIIKSIQGKEYSVSFKEIPELISLDYEYGNNNIIFIDDSQLLVIHELGLSLWEIDFNSESFVKLYKTIRFIDDKLPFPIIGRYEMLLDKKHKRVVIDLGQGYFTTISLTDLSLSTDSFDMSDFCSIMGIELSPDEDYILCSGYKEYDENNNLGQNYSMNTLLLLRADSFEYVDTFYFEKGFTVAHFAENGKILIASIDGNIYSVEFPNLQDLINQQQERFKDCPLTTFEKNQFYIM